MVQLAPVEVVHGEAGVAGDFVQTLPRGHRLLNHVVVPVDVVTCISSTYLHKDIPNNQK